MTANTTIGIFAPTSRSQPPKATMRSIATLNKSKATTPRRAVCDSGRSLLGCRTGGFSSDAVTSSHSIGCKSRLSRGRLPDVRCRDFTHADVAELVDAPALGAGGRESVEVRVLSSALQIPWQYEAHGCRSDRVSRGA